MSSLSDLTNAGTESAIPGHVLSKPGLLQLGKAEQHFAQQYITTMAQGAAMLPPKPCADLMAAVSADVRLAEFLYGGNVFYLWASAKSSFPHLTLWSLQVKHPQMTMEKVVGFYETFDADAIAKATFDLWFPPQPVKRRPTKRNPKAIDWDAIYKRCVSPTPEGFGMTQDQFNALTIPQLAAMLGRDTDLSHEEAEAVRQDAAFDQYDRICAALKINPAELAAKPDDELEPLVRQQMPEHARTQAIDRNKLRELVTEYAKEHGSDE